MIDIVDRCASQIRKYTDFVPKVALVLGSGLGALADEINVVCRIDYHDIDRFPTSTVAGHQGRFVFGYISQTPVVIMQGRVHYYEGYDIHDVVLPIRVMRLLGADILFLTNAAGGVSDTVSKGDLMLISDQISSFVPSPLIGPNDDRYGERFPSMDTIYDVELKSIIRQISDDLDISLKEGVYLQTTGPEYESPAEVKMFRLLGADAVGMSTAIEAITARHMGMRVCGISCITNMAGGTSDEPLSHTDVSKMADKVAPQFKNLVRLGIERMIHI